MASKNYNILIFSKKVLLLFSIFSSLISKGQELQTYIQEAVANNPMISSSELRYDIAKEKITEVNSLPNTKIGISYFGSMPETRLGAQQG